MFLCCSIYFPLQEIIGLGNGFLVEYNDIETVNENKTFGDFFKVQLNEKEKIVGGQKVKQGEVVFKLFGFIPIKKVDVVLASDYEYYVGGVPIGLSIYTNGAIVVSEENNIDTSLKEGDIITQINGHDV